MVWWLCPLIPIHQAWDASLSFLYCLVISTSGICDCSVFLGLDCLGSLWLPTAPGESWGLGVRRPQLSSWMICELTFCLWASYFTCLSLSSLFIKWGSWIRGFWKPFSALIIWVIDDTIVILLNPITEYKMVIMESDLQRGGSTTSVYLSVIWSFVLNELWPKWPSFWYGEKGTEKE